MHTFMNGQKHTKHALSMLQLQSSVSPRWVTAESCKIWVILSIFLILMVTLLCIQRCVCVCVCVRFTMEHLQQRDGQTVKHDPRHSPWETKQHWALLPSCYKRNWRCPRSSEESWPLRTFVPSWVPESIFVLPAYFFMLEAWKTIPHPVRSKNYRLNFVQCVLPGQQTDK